MAKHMAHYSEQATSTNALVVAESGIPYAVGTAPIHLAESPAPINTPVLVKNYEEAVKMFGYSDNWKDFTLCELIYSHFKLYECQPVILCNVLDLKKCKEAVAAADVAVTNHKVTVENAINDETLIVKATAESESALVKGVDFDTYYSGDNLIIELIETSTSYKAENLNVAYTKITPASVTNEDVVTGVEKVDLCVTTVGVIPDLVLAPKFSTIAVVAAAITAKAANINGIFAAKPLIDIDSGLGGATTYTEAIAKKNELGLSSSKDIACWPMVKMGGKTYHMSTHLAGGIAVLDTENEGCPYESPSNKAIKCDSLALATGETINLNLAEANMLDANGVVTAINFVNGWTFWGNHTACYPASTDVKDNMISVSRMFSWVGSTLVKMLWSRLDKPMSRVLVDNIVDIANIWLNGLTGRGFILGGSVTLNADENPIEKLMQGVVKFRVKLTPPSPAQEFDFVLEYDLNNLANLFAA